MRSPFLNFMRAESHGGRWKWGSSNVTGKVDEVVHEGQAQVQSDKVRMPHSVDVDMWISVVLSAGFDIG